ncbi:Sugar transferase involved in LPS biosynthesis (colanic, teichoic acid) [Micromonospora rhizosphaerae]|uniref:Sugar transferase involved in LPS biosynthesis (Colanic, teichoic acid) n=2 Tax=Micromonospora rhizosphaerae TaxID=568872 RepID=A0A1C6SMX2_9ACTN|nr:Sugar transferase involved in LPS biosynthesis (colanic, teichoic acid) [Micromonospora rhizosphaerae]
MGAWIFNALLAAAGVFVGGLVTTRAVVGLIEDNAPPQIEVRDRILAHHASRGLVYPPEPRLKRALDVTGALIGLVVTLPLWVVIACLIWLEEPGPILFTKNAVGKGGVTFRQFKFRSMTYEAERHTGPVASPANDPRTLRCGRWLRRWHLDELPELINVLAGTMSLVGPRPLRAVLVDRYLEELPEFADRHTVRPGIACIAQIQQYHISPADRLRKDRVYLRRMSVGFDIWLLWHAVVTTVRGSRPEAESDMTETVPPTPGPGKRISC